MYKIIFYKNARGEEPVLEYIKDLSEQENKEARIKLKKIVSYIDILSKNGTAAGFPYIKHLKGEIWELRPARDRILFAAYVNNSFILLHSFVKKTQKTPRRELIKAISELDEYKERDENNGI